MQDPVVGDLQGQGVQLCSGSLHLPNARQRQVIITFASESAHVMPLWPKLLQSVQRYAGFSLQPRSRGNSSGHCNCQANSMSCCCMCTMLRHQCIKLIVCSDKGSSKISWCQPGPDTLIRALSSRDQFDWLHAWYKAWRGIQSMQYGVPW